MSRPVIVIPARAGSKRLPGKNLMQIGGKSLVRRCVETAVASKLGEVFINSEDPAILKEGKETGAMPFQRPESLALDAVATEAVLASMGRMFNWEDDQTIILMQCTSPFTTPQLVRYMHHNYARHRPIATAGTFEDVSDDGPNGAVYVFPYVLAAKKMLFDPAINWFYVRTTDSYGDIDTQADFDKAMARHKEEGK